MSGKDNQVNKMQYLALDIAGTPHRWLDADRAAYYVATGKVAWSLGDPSVVLHGGVQRISGQQSILSLPPVIALAKSEAMVRHARAIPLGRDSNVLLGKRDRMVCGLCGERIAIGDLTRDHVIPRARGGKDVWTNVVAAHRSCNMRKGCRTQRRGCHCFTFPMILAGSSTSFYLAVTSSSTRCLTW